MSIHFAKSAQLLSGALILSMGLSGCMGQAKDPHDNGSSKSKSSSKSSAVSVSSKSNSMISSQSSVVSMSSTPTTGTGKTAFGIMTISGLGGVAGQMNYESVRINVEDTGFDKVASYKHFANTLYPVLVEQGCNKCHTSQLSAALEGQQAPFIADSNVELAHEYALTAVNFKNPQQSKLVEHVGIYRHYCGESTCASTAKILNNAVVKWAAGVASFLPKPYEWASINLKVDDEMVNNWVAEDKANLTIENRPYTVYTSFHSLFNAGYNIDELNIARVAVAKMLNSTARWAPITGSLIDINGKGLVFRFDIREYWGYNQGVTRLLFGGSDDDLAFGNGKKDYQGNAVSASVENQKYNFTKTIVKDPEHALRIWERILHGNVEGAATSGTLPPNIDGFMGVRKKNAAGEYADINGLKWVEASQLVYTLSRPDVYNAIMTNPWYADELEDNLKVVKDKGIDSYDYIVSRDTSAVDSRFMFRANTAENGMYWKTFDVFTGDTEKGDFDMREVYSNAEGNKKIRFPFWANPIPKFVNWVNTTPDDLKSSFVATLAQVFASSGASGVNTEGCDPMPSYAGSTFKYCRHYTGLGGMQQASSDIIYTLPNGLHGYYLAGGQNQRRTDQTAMIYRDPRLVPTANDDINYMSGNSYNNGTGGTGVNSPRANVGASCISCHRDGIKRVNNDMREWLDQPAKLPVGQYGVDGWINDAATVTRVKELYKTNNIMKPRIEKDRYNYLHTIARLQNGLVTGPDLNIYVEPVTWAAEAAQKLYKYKKTTSN